MTAEMLHQSYVLYSLLRASSAQAEAFRCLLLLVFTTDLDASIPLSFR
jgi:hypothetical protein